MSINEICFSSIKELLNNIKKKNFSCEEIIKAHFEQINKYNSKLNAIITLDQENAISQAKKYDAKSQKTTEIKPLEGIPLVHKDLIQTKGLLTTYGSPIYRDNIPTTDNLIVKRLKNAGAITLGKTNTPEFGAGSQTFNPLFGQTLNPYDLSKPCGGSSGGSAVALTTGMAPIATGSDLGGSLRNPASYCNVIGFRTSMGRIPTLPSENPWLNMTVEGPMARTIEDIAIILSIIAGPNTFFPLSINESSNLFLNELKRDFQGVKIAWAPNIANLPMESEIPLIMKKHLKIFEELGCSIEEIDPDFSGADEVFKTLRAFDYAISHKHLLDNHKEQLKDTVIWNIEQGLKLSSVDIGKALKKRTEIFNKFVEFTNKFEYIILPVSQVLPFDVNKPYVDEINGVKMDSYIDWMKSCYYISITDHPAISVPCGFSKNGSPFGMQIVGRHKKEFSVLQLAHAFEEKTQYWKIKPKICSDDQ